MEFLSRLTAALKSAMLARETDKVGTLRLLISELKNTQIKKGSELTEDETLQVIRREVKKRQEAVTLYTNLNQPDRANQEQSEITVLNTYLPAALEESVIETYAQELMKTVGATPAVRGTLIKQTMNHFGSQADGKVVSGIISKLLN